MLSAKHSTAHEAGAGVKAREAKDMRDTSDNAVLERLPEPVRETVEACRRALSRLDDVDDRGVVVGLLMIGVWREQAGEPIERCH